MDFGLKGQVAMITGAGAGIGLATTKAFLAEGASVIAADLDIAALTALNAGDRVLPIVADLSVADGASVVVAAGLKAFGRIDILFNNAGALRPRAGFMAISEEDWARTLNLNVLGYIRAARAVLPTMLEQKRGCLIHNASEAGRIANPRAVDYCVSKAAVLMLSKALSLEFTSQGVRSNVVSPSQVRTAMLDGPGGVFELVARQLGVDTASAEALFLKQVAAPAGRFGTAEEVAAAVLYLASNQAGFITGIELPVDGGVRTFV